MTKTLGFETMVAFCNEIVNEIERAESEEELIKIISSSMTRLRKVRNSFNESGYTMNMIVTLRAVHPGQVSARSLHNIRLAIAIFRQFQKKNPGRAF